jgi:hypothetical protein
MMRFLTLVTIGIAAALGASQAYAESSVPCGDRSKLISALDAKYKEGLSGFGVTGGSQLVEIYVSETGTFTVVMTNSKGISCVIAAGDSWEKLSVTKRLTSM